MPHATRRIAGCDLGQATARFVVGVVNGGSVRIDSSEVVSHDGRPLEAFRAWYRRADVASCAALGATGVFADEVVAPASGELPEDACLEAALPHLPPGPLNLVRVGARGYSALSRGEDGRVQHVGNEKCSAGTGETMLKLAARFGLTLDEADRAAGRVTRSIPITARCSVFAKSEMTHYGNQGKPAAELFRGYFESVAGYVAALLGRIQVPGPVYLTGGGARLAAFVRALGEATRAPIVVPAEAQLLESLGALRLAAEGTPPDRLPDDPDALLRPRQRRFEVLAPARLHASRVTRMEAPCTAAGAERAPAVLGLDLGSTGSKAALVSLETGEVLLDVYDRTRGNPVEAQRRLLATLAERGPLDVRAVGLTGSGREAAATVLRAVWPDAAGRILVVNEIVAHATAAIRCDPDGGKSLSVIEIGGQDAKFIQIAGGHVVESDMNKACSAGTGSFLEEQASLYGVTDIGEFTRVATLAERPPDLGQMCTVFVAEAAAEAHGQGFALADLFGGFQHSVIHNYVNRVMGQRSLGERVFFQGKPASGPSLAWTLAAVTGRDVVVPPNPGAMGAWGIGLCALEALGQGALSAAPPLDLDRVQDARQVAEKEVQCRDRGCATYCAIRHTTVEVSGTEHTVLSGGACPKYEVATAARAKLPRDAPSAFDEREALLSAWADERSGGAGAVVGVPLVGAVHGVAPWLAAFARGLGLGVRVLRPGPQALARGEARCVSYDACAPAKVAHGLDVEGVSAVLFPKLAGLGDRDGDGGRCCAMEVALPELLREALRAAGNEVKVVHPHLDLSRPAALQLGALAEAARALGADEGRVPEAIRLADRAQHRWDEDLATIGHRTLAYAAATGTPVVAVCGSLHVLHDRAINAGIPKLLHEHGVLAVPMDCFPLPGSAPPLAGIAWADLRRALRVAIAGRARGGVYPLLVTAFGCGPMSFGEQSFASLCEGWPHTVLESDGHGGQAGYVTRIEAFLHAVRRHDGRPMPVLKKQARALEPDDPPPLLDRRDDARLVPIGMGDLSPLFAACYRAFGFDAVPSGTLDADALRLGRRDCSGKECLPYQLVWGGFAKRLEADNGASKPTVLLQVNGEGMCRNCMFTVKDRLTLERRGLAPRVTSHRLRPEPGLKWPLLERVQEVMLAWDLLNQLRCYLRPTARDPERFDALYVRFTTELEALAARPARTGLPGLFDVGRGAGAIDDLLRRAARAFAYACGPDDPALRTVLLSGDVYVRLDPFASDDLVRRLNQRGLRVLLEPVMLLTEYMAVERLSELMGLPTGRLDNAVVRLGLKRHRRAAEAIVREYHPWLPSGDIEPQLAASRALLDRTPKGEAPVTVGSVLHQWAHGACDGVIVASPWGCGPALVAESLLRRRKDIPLLFLYCDGSPIDERKLQAFALKLKRMERRVGLVQASDSAPRSR